VLALITSISLRLPDPPPLISPEKPIFSTVNKLLAAV
jgi:hypothetical protein